MKKVLTLFSILVLVFSNNPLNAQSEINVDLVVFEPLPEINLGDILITNGLKGAQNIFQITFNPTPVNNIILFVQIDWKKDLNEGYQKLYNFTSLPFEAKKITNNDIGNTAIKAADESSNTDLLEELVKKGKPTGAIRIVIKVYDGIDKSKELGSDVEELNFLNPAQTLSIRTPEEGSTQNIGGVLAEWDEVTGVNYYTVRANIRKNINQSLEEALNSGNPLINNKDVGNSTSVNLRELLDREWLPGQEIVFQVTANISGPGGGTKLFSNIVNFHFETANTEDSRILNQSFLNLFQNFGDENSSRIISLLQSGQISLNDVTISFDDGQVMTIAEFQNIMNYLETNPDAVISINYTAK